jgi:purine nucleosidase
LNANATTRVVLDVDTGVDDAAALLFAATHPDVTLDAVVSTWGNTTVELATRNSLHVLEAAECAAPVYIGAAGPSGPAPPVVDPSIIMGQDGLGDLGLSPPGRAAAPAPAAQALIELTHAHPGEITLVCLAPMTTIAAALAIDPDLPNRVARLLHLGGTLSGSGNATPAGEANIAHDPLAAAAVFEAFGAVQAPDGEPVARMIPLDVSGPVVFTTDFVEQLRTSSVAGASLLDQVLSAVWAMASLEGGGHGVMLADLVATVPTVASSLFDWRTYPVAVDTGGSAAWGATVVDRRLDQLVAADLDPAMLALVDEIMWTFPSKWSVATALDQPAFHDTITAWLAGSV